MYQVYISNDRALNITRIIIIIIGPYIFLEMKPGIPQECTRAL